MAGKHSPRVRSVMCAGCDQKDVRAETRALMPGPDLRHNATRHYRPHPGNLTQRDHDIVQLQVGSIVKGHRELERGGVFGSRNPSDHASRVWGSGSIVS